MIQCVEHFPFVCVEPLRLDLWPHNDSVCVFAGITSHSESCLIDDSVSVSLVWVLPVVGCPFLAVTVMALGAVEPMSLAEFSEAIQVVIGSWSEPAFPIWCLRIALKEGSKVILHSDETVLFR